MQSENTADFAAALAKAQGQMKSIPFDRENPHFKSGYASLASVIDTVRKPLADNGLSYTQVTKFTEAGAFVLVTTLRHATGQWVSGEWPLPMAARPQEMGSALTYARRYGLSAIVCVASDDDNDANGTDGQKASTPKPKVAPNPIKPQAHDPETGEVKDALIIGRTMAKAARMSETQTDLEEWLAGAAQQLDGLKESAPEIHAKVEAVIEEKRQSFKKKEAA
jgi:hypothetical protein